MHGPPVCGHVPTLTVGKEYWTDHAQVLASTRVYTKTNLEGRLEDGLLSTLLSLWQLLQPRWCLTQCSAFHQRNRAADPDDWVNPRSPHTFPGLRLGEEISLPQTTVLRYRRMQII